ncbi:hypothetical protein Naga_101795g1, partial [Nannochloropsis gaditana]
MSQWNNPQSSQEEVTREERKRLAHGWDGGQAKEEREENKEERKEKGLDKEGTIEDRDQEQQFLVSVPWSHKTRCITLSVPDKKGGMAAVTAAEIVEAVLGMDNLMTEAPRIKSGTQGVDVAPMPTSAMLIECGGKCYRHHETLPLCFPSLSTSSSSSSSCSSFLMAPVLRLHSPSWGLMG